MANKTTNYGLTKPSQNEFYDIDVQNANMDIIDSQIKNIDDKVKNLSTDAGDLTGTLPVAHGGTGATTASVARSNLGAASASELSSLAISVNNHAAASNPHGITPEKIGAAKSTHAHSASDITSGSMSSDRLPVVPIAKGGTGASTASQALVNLGAASKTHSHSASDVGAAPANHNHASTNNVPGVIQHYHVAGGNGTNGTGLYVGMGSTNHITPGMWFVTTDNYDNFYLVAGGSTRNILTNIKFPALIYVSHLVDNSYDVVDVMGAHKATVTMNTDGSVNTVTGAHYPSYEYSTAGLSDGSPLTTGKLYFVYE